MSDNGALCMRPPHRSKFLLSRNSFNWRTSEERLPPDCNCCISAENMVCCTLYNHFRFAPLSSVADNGPTVGDDELDRLQLCINRRTYAVTDSSYVRVLNLEMSMKLRIPLVTKVVISCTTSSSSSVTWICKVSDCCHVGHCDGEESNFGPCFHCSDELRVSYEIPLVSRSAGLSAEGQYLQVAGLERISSTRRLTNGFKDFLLFIHARTN